MRPSLRRSICAVLLLSVYGGVLSSCEKSKSASRADAGVDGDGADRMAATATSCLDEANTLPRAPQGTLPCELIPPGLTLR